MANKQTAERLERILESARAILRETGDSGFTIKDIAKHAGVAPATVFNLLGNKDGVYYALLSRLLDDLFIGILRYEGEDPLQHAVEATDYLVDLFLTDDTVFRELFLIFLGARNELHRPWFMHRSLSFWRHSVSNAARTGLIDEDEYDEDAIPRALMLMFIGSVDLWVHGDLCNEDFRSQALYGSAVVILGAATEEANTKPLRKRLKGIKNKLPRHHTFLRHLVPPGQKLTGAQSIPVPRPRVKK